MNITIQKIALSDGSHVYDVRVGALTLHAVTEADAYALAERLADAINKHTTAIVDDWSVEPDAEDRAPCDPLHGLRMDSADMGEC